MPTAEDVLGPELSAALESGPAHAYLFTGPRGSGKRDAARAFEAESGAAGRARAVADYIAGMTDRYAFQEHARLLG